MALLQFWVGNELLKTVARTSRGEVRNKNALGTAPRRHGGARKIEQITRSTTATYQPKASTPANLAAWCCGTSYAHLLDWPGAPLFR